MSNSSLKLLPTLLVGIALFMAAFLPRANAAEITYFNFEDSTLGAPPDFHSDGALSTTITTNYSAAGMSSVSPGVGPVAPGDLDPNNLALGLSHTLSNSPADFNIPLVTAAGIQNMNLSFAYIATGNGFTTATLWYSTNGGATFTNSGLSDPLALTDTPQVAPFTVPTAANNAPNLELRIEFTGGQANGNELEDTIDNIQVTGTINPAGVPDTGTTASLFGFSLVGLAFLRRKLA